MLVVVSDEGWVDMVCNVVSDAEVVEGSLDVVRDVITTEVLLMTVTDPDDSDVDVGPVVEPEVVLIESEFDSVKLAKTGIPGKTLSMYSWL